jgi:hypothetical protein
LLLGGTVTQLAPPPQSVSLRISFERSPQDGGGGALVDKGNIAGTGVPSIRTVVHVGSIMLDSAVALATMAIAIMISFIAVVVLVKSRDNLRGV